MLSAHRPAVLGVLVILAGTLVAQTPASKPSKPRGAESKPAPSRFTDPPDDRYVKVLAGKSLEEGKGFPGVVVVGPSSRIDVEKIGFGREDFSWPFWYFYEKGPWQLTVATVMHSDMSGATTQAVIVAGAAAPGTKKGLKIGDPISKAKQIYGEPGPFDGALVGLENLGRKRTRYGFGKSAPEEQVISDPPEFAGALFFPAERLLVAVENDKVKKLAIVFKEDPLPAFLRPAESVTPNRDVVIDATVKVPKAVPADPAAPEKSGLKFLVPPLPPMETVKMPHFTASVPKTWTQGEDGFWKDPESNESVGIQVMEGNSEDTPERILSMINESVDMPNLVAPFRRHLPADFCKRAGVTNGYCALVRAPGRGKDELDLLMYQMMLAKGTHRYLVMVTRTAHPTKIKLPKGGTSHHAFMGSPDGDALARAVMTSLRILD